VKFHCSVDFPDPRQTLAEGVLAVGGKLDIGTLHTAYSKGVFPWPQEGLPMLWFSPERRGILEFKDFHVPEVCAGFADAIHRLSLHLIKILFR